jgi:hypothetical protein
MTFFAVCPVLLAFQQNVHKGKGKGNGKAVPVLN